MKKNLLKHIALILLQCLLSTSIFAQTSPLPKQWDKRFGGTYDNQLKSLQQTTDGGYILGGYSNSEIGGDKTEASRGGTYDYWVLKINSNGIKEWDKRFGGTSDDYFTCLQQTTDGGYILGGYTGSGIGGDKTESSRGYSDYWVVKIDATGIKEWDKRFGGTIGDELHSLQQTTDGGYILGGYSLSGTGGDKTEASRGYSDYWVVKIDANGIKEWDKRFGGTYDEQLYSLQQTTDRGYILGGYSQSDIGGDKTQASRGYYDYWIVKINAQGIKEWDKRFGGKYDDFLQSLQQTTDGGYILGGWSNSGIEGDKTEASRGYYDYWAVKIDAHGVKEWDKRFGGTDNDLLFSLQQTTDDGYILGGYSYSGIGGDVTQVKRGISDYWIVKTDINGNKEWDEHFGGNNEDYLTSLQQATDEGYILGGSSSSGISHDKTQATRGFYDYWVVKLGCPPSTKVIATGGKDLCQTGAVTLAADHSAGVKYQWYKDGQKIEGATSRTYVATEPGRYRVRVGTDWQCGTLSDLIIVTNSCGRVSNSLTIYPNPSKGIVTATYQSNSSGNIQLNVFDKTGKLMFTKTENAIKGSNTYQLNLSNLINGMYNLQINNASEQSQAKFIIEK